MDEIVQSDNATEPYEHHGSRRAGLLRHAEVERVDREARDVHAGAGDAREHAAAEAGRLSRRVTF